MIITRRNRPFIKSGESAFRSDTRLLFLNCIVIILPMVYTVIVEKGRESGYIVYVPALRGCVSQGDTRAQALLNIKEAMEVYVEALIEDGFDVVNI